MRADDAPADLQEPLGRHARHLDGASVEVARERRRVDAAGPQIHLDRIGVCGHAKPLGEVGLENVAGVHQFDARADHLKIRVAGMRRSNLRMRGKRMAARGGNGRRDGMVAGRCGRFGEKGGESLGRPARPLDRSAGGNALGNKPALAEVVVVSEDEIVDVEREHRLEARRGCGFKSQAGQPAFVGDEAGHAPLKRR